MTPVKSSKVTTSARRRWLAQKRRTGQTLNVKPCQQVIRPNCSAWLFTRLDLAGAAIYLVFALWSHTAARAQTFGNVTMGGAGYVTGIIMCPNEPNLIYAKTDVGGA